jgi:hypothetical protein
MARVKDTVIACYSLKGKLIRVYPTATAAARSRHLFKRTIDRATRGDLLTAKNQLWRRVDKDNVPETIEPYKKEKHSNINKRVAKLDENGNIVKIYPSLSQAAKENKIDPHTLRDRLNGKYSSNNKSKFKYVD